MTKFIILSGAVLLSFAACVESVDPVAEPEVETPVVRNYDLTGPGALDVAPAYATADTLDTITVGGQRVKLHNFVPAVISNADAGLAAVALSDFLSTGVTQCVTVRTVASMLTAACYVNEQEIAAWMIAQGYGSSV